MKQSVTEFLNSIIHLPYKQQTDAIGLFLIGQEEALSLATANLTRADEKIAELQEFIKRQSADLERATAKAKAIDRLAQQFSEEISQAFRKHGLAAGPTALDRVMQQLEEARKARDIAEAKGRWLDGVKVTTTAQELAIALPPDILMAPMPFPDRLDYAGKIIQAAFERWFKA